MMTISDVKQWIAELNPDNHIAIDDGGLCLVELSPDGRETGAYCEIGGVPDHEDEDLPHADLGNQD